MMRMGLTREREREREVEEKRRVEKTGGIWEKMSLDAAVCGRYSHKDVFVCDY
jgi:hypothetical protein